MRYLWMPWRMGCSALTWHRARPTGGTILEHNPFHILCRFLVVLCVIEFLVSVLLIFLTFVPHSRLSALFLTMMAFAYWMRKPLCEARVTFCSILEVSHILGPLRSAIYTCPLTARKGTGRRGRRGKTPKIEHRLIHATLKKLNRSTGDVYLASCTAFSRVLFPCYNVQRRSLTSD